MGQAMVRVAVPMLSLVAAMVPPGPAAAHTAPSGWQFPVECCGGHDCYEIDASEVVPAMGSWHILASGEFFSARRVRPSRTATLIAAPMTATGAGPPTACSCRDRTADAQRQPSIGRSRK